MRRHILFVHGHHFKASAQALFEVWDDAIQWGMLRDRPEALDVYQQAGRSMAYYGDLSNELLRGTGLVYDEALDIADQRNALDSLKDLDKAKRFRRRDYDQLPGRSALRNNLTQVAAPLLHSLQLKESVLAKVVPELTNYWQPESEFARAIATRVDEALHKAFDNHDELLIVAHGFGSVLMYDTLWLMSHEKSTHAGRKVDCLLTLGSPLGDETVKTRLLGARQSGPGRYPTNIVSWANLAATHDFVSHDRTLADDYRPMLRHRQISRINDYRIHNLSVRYGRSNPHSALGYLIHPRLAKVICTWLQRDAT